MLQAAKRAGATASCGRGELMPNCDTAPPEPGGPANRDWPRRLLDGYAEQGCARRLEDRERRGKRRRISRVRAWLAEGGRFWCARRG